SRRVCRRLSRVSPEIRLWHDYRGRGQQARDQFRRRWRQEGDGRLRRARMMSPRSRPFALPLTRAQSSNPVWHVLARVRGAEAAGKVFSVLDEIAGAVWDLDAAAEEGPLGAYLQSPVRPRALA